MLSNMSQIQFCMHGNCFIFDSIFIDFGSLYKYELTKMENQYAKNGEKNVDGMNECGTQEIKANTETFRFISLFFNVATTSSLLFLSTNEFEQSSFNSTEIIDSMLKVVKKTNSFFFFRIVRGVNLSTWRFFDQCEL